MVEGYVKDLCIIRAILAVAPFAIIVFRLVSSILSNGHLDAYSVAMATFNSLLLSGCSIFGYIGHKYNYKPFGEEISIPAWRIVLVVVAGIVLCFGGARAPKFRSSR